MSELILPELEIAEIQPPKNRKFVKRPDNQVRDEQINKLKAEVKVLDTELAQIATEFDTAVTPKDDIKIRNQLTEEHRTLIKSLGDLKKKKQIVNDQIKALDEGIKRKVSEIQQKTSKYDFKTTEDIDKKIRKLEASIESGNLMLVDEKKSVKEISSLNKLKKDFGSVEQTQKLIDSDKQKISELKASLSSFTNKEVQAKLDELSKQLDALTLKNQGVNTKRNTLYARRKELYTKKDALRDEIRSIYDSFDTKFQKFKSEMEHEKNRREEEEKAYRLYLKKKDLIEEIKEIVEEAKQPAYSAEITQLDLLILKLDPSSETKVAQEEDNNIELPEGAELIKKTEESFFLGTAKSKKKRSIKPKKAKFVIDPSFIGILAEFDVAIPTNETEIPSCVDALKEKLTYFKDNQQEASKKQIALAQEKIDAINKKIAKLDIEIEEELEKEKNKFAAEKEEAKADLEEASEVIEQEE